MCDFGFTVAVQVDQYRKRINTSSNFEHCLIALIAGSNDNLGAQNTTVDLHHSAQRWAGAIFLPLAWPSLQSLNRLPSL
jgi:hypothetical protein